MHYRAVSLKVADGTARIEFLRLLLGDRGIAAAVGPITDYPPIRVTISGTERSAPDGGPNG